MSLAHTAVKPVSAVMLDAYANAFSGCYPDKEVSFQGAGKGKAYVVINGDRGERPLTAEELTEATAEFNRGKRKG